MSPIPGIVASSYTVAGTTGLTLPGTSGNYLSVPDSSDLDISGDLTIAVDVAQPDWTPVGNKFFIGKTAASNISYGLRATATGALGLILSANGATSAAVTSNATGAADGSALCVGVTYRVSDRRVQFWTAATGTATVPGGSGWTQLGADQTHSVASIFVGTSPIEIGSQSGGTLTLLAGTLYRVRVWASIDGTDQRLDVNCVGQTKTATRTPSTFVEAAKSATVTCNGSAWDWTP